MKSTSILVFSFLLAFGVVHSRAQTTLFYDGFENGMDLWSATSMWHVESQTDPCGASVAPFPGGAHIARFGAQSPFGACAFPGTPAGSLTLSTPVSIPASALSARLRYSTYEDTECQTGNCGWDHRTVYVSDDGGQSWSIVAGGGLELAWFPKFIDLSDFIGADVMVRFDFDAVDESFNNFFGWGLDEVAIEIDEPTPIHYCAAKVNSIGCTPVLTSSGVASLTSTTPFTVTATQILNQAASKMIWSRGYRAHPFQGGTLCVSVPAARTSVTSSGGTIGATDCSGVYSWVFSPSYLASKSFFAGETLHVQFSGRDPGFAAPNNHSLSAALAVMFTP